jgi:hypothetical protein
MGIRFTHFPLQIAPPDYQTSLVTTYIGDPQSPYSVRGIRGKRSDVFKG